ncbi:hypothetical protein GALMADRAFT_145779 [Galerina marginata CBS 339.88]|uniref:Uncharacterized protein n=1 Tax=Galerina marginata (strain CBS 339.88) TaxID=685588 RepID=A0A067SQK5_GALM3|nr:hypothetical protein GALMADRAFT_145779 [Galerina marginata CBS 339.88]
MRKTSASALEVCASALEACASALNPCASMRKVGATALNIPRYQRNGNPYSEEDEKFSKVAFYMTETKAW